MLLSEFSLVDRRISLFEAASGCVLHRNPASAKVKFLPLGRWKGTLQQEDIPVNYIALSDHLDMIGVRLLATATKTRKVNGDILVDKICNTIWGLKWGKFMPLTMRPFSLNSYCLSKLWFRCGSINLRVRGVNVITSHVKSWLFADQLELPEEHILFRPRVAVGLGLHNIKYKSMSLIMKSFL